MGRYITVEESHSGPHKHCDDPSIETKSGKFTFHPQNWKTRDGAREFCKERGEILAPITNWDDFYRLRNFTDGCTNLGGFNIYSTGLDFVDDKVRYFTNGEAYDESKHGSLYVPLKEKKYPKSYCFFSLFSTRPATVRMPVVASKRCLDWGKSFICLKPANITLCPLQCAWVDFIRKKSKVFLNKLRLIVRLI